MGLFDTFNAMVDMVNTTVEVGKEMYRVQELVNENYGECGQIYG